MTERKAQSDPTDPPEDVASLYSWANLHGAKYRDFSASRAQTREKARQRVEQAIEQERPRARQEAEALRVEAARDEERRQMDLAAQQAALQAAQQAALQAAQAAQRMQHPNWPPRITPPPPPYQQPQPPASPIQPAQPAQPTQPASRMQPPPQMQPDRTDRDLRTAPPSHAEPRPAQPDFVPPSHAPGPFEPPPAAPPSSSYATQPQAASPAQPTYAPSTQPSSAPISAEPVSSAPRSSTPPQWPPASSASSPPISSSLPPRPPSPPVSGAPMHEDSYAPPRVPRHTPSAREEVGRPAWLSPDRFESAAAHLPPAAHEDTLQGSRERLASRWYSLQGIFEGTIAPPVQAAPAPVPSRAPAMAIFSLAGGVGKTSLVATLGRALSGRGERVLLVDTAAYGLLPFFFGARDQRPGFLRTFSPPPSSGDAPIQIITIDPDTVGSEAAAPEALANEISKLAHGAGRVLIDLATASGATARRVMRLAPHVLVPLIPDMSSVVSVGSIDAFFQHNNGNPANPGFPHYILNQFDPSLPLHLDIREILREQLGDRLLPFAIRHAPAVSEALAEGMTIMDYAPNSAVADDYASLAAWVKSLSAPAVAAFRGVRWSER